MKRASPRALVMPDSGEAFFLVLAAGAGAALFFALREFVRGVSAAQRKHGTSNVPDGHADGGFSRDHRPTRSWRKVATVIGFGIVVLVSMGKILSHHTSQPIPSPEPTFDSAEVPVEIVSDGMIFVVGG